MAHHAIRQSHRHRIERVLGAGPQVCPRGRRLDRMVAGTGRNGAPRGGTNGEDGGMFGNVGGMHTRGALCIVPVRGGIGTRLGGGGCHRLEGQVLPGLAAVALGVFESLLAIVLRHDVRADALQRLLAGAARDGLGVGVHPEERRSGGGGAAAGLARPALLGRSIAACTLEVRLSDSGREDSSTLPSSGDGTRAAGLASRGSGRSRALGTRAGVLASIACRLRSWAGDGGRSSF